MEPRTQHWEGLPSISGPFVNERRVYKSMMNLSSMTRKLLAITIVTLLAPVFTFAAATDVNLDPAETSITSGGITYRVYGSNAVIESLTVNESDFSFVVEIGSSIQLFAPNGYTIPHNASGSFVTSQTCIPGSEYRIKFEGINASTTVTVTPGTTACKASTQSTATGGSGGGGGGVSTPSTSAQTTKATTTTATATATQAGTGSPTDEQRASLIASLTAQLNALVSQITKLQGKLVPGSFARDLRLGSIGEDVRSLQVYLNTHGYVLATKGPGSSGNETTRFGPATRAALVKLQKAAGITPAAGYFGAKTRTYVTTNP